MSSYGSAKSGSSVSQSSGSYGSSSGSGSGSGSVSTSGPGGGSSSVSTSNNGSVSTSGPGGGGSSGSVSTSGPGGGGSSGPPPVQNFNVLNLSWYDAGPDAPSTLDFDIENTLGSDIDLTAIVCSATGFNYPMTLPAVVPPYPPLHVTCYTEPNVDFTFNDVLITVGGYTYTIKLY